MRQSCGPGLHRRDRRCLVVAGEFVGIGPEKLGTSLSHVERVLALATGAPGPVERPVTQIGNHIAKSWRRCLTQYGLEPDRVPRTPVLSLQELKSSRETVDDLIAVAVPELRRLLLHLQESEYVLTMTDASGVAVLARYAPSLRHEVELARTIAGSVWLEEHQGTNGIGTCLAERAPLSVVMDDHFNTRLVRLSCTVAPMFAGDGGLLGVINVTTPQRSSHDVQAMVRRTVMLSARRIENLHLQRQHAGRRILRLSRDNDFADLAQEARVALDDGGRVLAATPGVAELLGTRTPSLIGQPVSDVLDRDDLAETADMPIMLRQQAGPPLFVHVMTRRRPPTNGSRHTRPPTPPAAPDPTDFRAGSRLALRLLAGGLPVLLQGETGSGKSALARTLHDAGPRAKRPFVAVNCAAIPAELIEGEFFGHVPGAYTGASRTGAKGLIRAADGGTLFLDEIGDMPLSLQTRLLRVLSDGEVVPLGATRGVPVDIAVIAATLHDIAELVRHKRFREDLYFRLSGMTLTLPPLRERADWRDVVDGILREEAARAGCKSAWLANDALDALRAYRWPGNLRELRHALRYAITIVDGPEISAGYLPSHVCRGTTGDDVDKRGGLDRDALERMLAETGWNVSAAARRLGISRATLHRKLPTSALRPSRNAPGAC